MSALASAQRKKAVDFQTQAAAASQKKSWFASGREKNQEEAAELYQQAANAFKVGGFGHEAGAAYMQAASLHRDALKNPVEASKCFSSAGVFFRTGIVSQQSSPAHI
jgi:alpha-soluble NSF attachment protein